MTTDRTRPSARRPRDLDAILHTHPRNVAEERLFDRHIADACRKIRESWTPDEEAAHRSHFLDGDVVCRFHPDGWTAPSVAMFQLDRNDPSSQD